MNPVRKVFDILENLPDSKMDPNETEQAIAAIHGYLSNFRRRLGRSDST